MKQLHTDFDECQNMNGLCEQICHNTNGSYECTCRSGFELLGNGHSCEGYNDRIYKPHILVYVFIMADIDECFEAALMSTDLCAHDKNTQCMNLEGSYECTCVPGYSRENGTCQSKFIIIVDLPLLAQEKCFLCSD